MTHPVYVISEYRTGALITSTSDRGVETFCSTACRYNSQFFVTPNLNFTATVGGGGRKPISKELKPNVRSIVRRNAGLSHIVCRLPSFVLF